ncbi:MAG TPA: hypothetical protein VLH15_06205 [Dehalococcoidales bacterium]|nr:hypothetical protein [Dehalococcoidales bacterium]
MESKRYFEIVASRPKHGKEADYNQWYDRHVEDVFRFKSMRKVTRTHCFYPLEPRGSYRHKSDCPQYITIYEFDSKEELLDFFNELTKGAFDEPKKEANEVLFELDWAAGYESGVTLQR